MKCDTVFLNLMFWVTILLVFGSSAQAQGIRNDDFTGALNTAVWRALDPLGDDTIGTTGTHVRISVPDSVSHDPYTAAFGGNKAPRIVQQVASPGFDVGNFDVVAKFDAAPTLTYQLHGIEIIQDHLNYVRCEFHSLGGAYYFYMQGFTNTGDAGSFSYDNVGMPPIGTAPIYMRVQRSGDTFAQYWSTNLDSIPAWNAAGTITHTMVVDSMGVYAGNATDGTNPAPAFVGLIDFFKNLADVPVQLSSFTATVVNQNRVRLEWTTATETNNYGFYVQRSLGGTDNFQRLEGSFIPGHGTTITPHSYSYIDAATAGVLYYRLEQIDLDGSVHLSESVQATVLTGADEGKGLPKEYVLRQNYPNPFNPSTIIKFELPKESRVSLEIFNLIGQKVATVVEGMKPAGSYEVPFNASGLTSGVYMYKLSAGNQVFTKKMVLMK